MYWIYWSIDKLLLQQLMPNSTSIDASMTRLICHLILCTQCPPKCENRVKRRTAAAAMTMWARSVFRSGKKWSPPSARQVFSLSVQRWGRFTTVESWSEIVTIQATLESEYLWQPWKVKKSDVEFSVKVSEDGGCSAGWAPVGGQTETGVWPEEIVQEEGTAAVKVWNMAQIWE